MDCHISTTYLSIYPFISTIRQTDYTLFDPSGALVFILIYYIHKYKHTNPQCAHFSKNFQFGAILTIYIYHIDSLYRCSWTTGLLACYYDCIYVSALKNWRITICDRITLCNALCRCDFKTPKYL